MGAIRTVRSDFKGVIQVTAFLFFSELQSSSVGTDFSWSRGHLGNMEVSS